MKVTKKIKISKNLSIIFWDEQLPTIRVRLYGSEIRSFKDFKREYRWRKRCRKHRRVQKIMKFIVKRLALYLLHQKEKKKLEGYRHNKAKIVYRPEGIDFYTYCKDKEMKKNCHEGTMFWACYIHDYIFLAHSEYGLYLEIIRKIIIEPTCIPFA